MVGISGRGPLIDGGEVSVPQSAMASVEGQYVIEGHGVDPDIFRPNMRWRMLSRNSRRSPLAIVPGWNH